MAISVTEFKQRCLEVIGQVERSGKAVTITRRGKIVARLEPPLLESDRPNLEPWQHLRAMGGRLLAKPDESVFKDEDFRALR